uniref:zinc finger protein 827-like n=1 Tax=Gasterosteus aculeatus aculeatus TaxID=481459 RepID=UPI001A9822D2|nr:zinc finger protein 827-like [Gasterosteus aculeatus aculeatus]
MKRGSSVLPPPSDAAKRHTHAANSQRTRTHAAGDGARSLSSHRAEQDAHAAGSSPFPAATSLFSPDVGTKMASDLLIRLSEATQKAQMHPGRLAEAEPQRRDALPEGRGGQQDEPGLALSPDGPGASPEPPSLSHTPDGNAATDTLASDLLRKLAERQEVSVHAVKVKEEEEPMQVDTLVTSDLARDRKETSLKTAGHRVFSIKAEDQAVNGIKGAEQLHPRDKMADGRLRWPGPKTPHGVVSGPNGLQFRVKVEDRGVSGTKMEDQLLFQAKIAERPFSAANASNKLLSGVKEEPAAARLDRASSGAKAEDQFPPGAKMADQCLRAALWQDMSVNLASTLLHQLSERVSKANTRPEARTPPPPLPPPATSSPVLKATVDALCSSQDPPHETESSLGGDRPTGCSYFYRCHVCGFETDGRGLFQSHMTDHRRWERGSFSLRCCVCDHSTNQEAEMRAHAVTHTQRNTGADGAPRCPVTSPAASGSTPSVAVATQLENSTSEHRCRICQRSFPGQQELQVHFQGHRHGNQYRCDRCGHLTRTANKLVEHVRVHTGERPFTCDLCPYSAKRRDSLRLHCKVKHPGDVHTHRSYVHRDNQRSNKHVQRLHTPANTHTAAASALPPLHPSLCDRAGWRDLSPLLPITTLISLKPRPLSSSSSSSSSSSASSAKHSFLGYLGLTTPL